MSDKRAKYEITEISHPQYPFLHRIRALQPVGTEVQPGDLGGFVEHEGNLSDATEDAAWVYDDAIACNDAYLDQRATLRDRAVACERAYLSGSTCLSGEARAEGDAFLRGAVVRDQARVSGTLLDRPSGASPEVCGESIVYGTVSGQVHITGSSVVFAGERFCNDTGDTWLIQDGRRTVERNPDRDALRPRQGQTMTQPKPKGRDKTAHER